MNSRQTYLSGAVMACCLGVFGLAHAQDVKPAAPVKSDAAAAKPAAASAIAKPATASKPAAKAVKSAKSSKKTETAKAKTTKAKTATTPSKTASAPAPVTAAPARMPAQAVNPYLAYRSANPYLPAQPANPYLAYRTANPAQPAMSANPLMALVPANVQKALKDSKTSHITFSPLPLDIFLLPNQKPTVAFTTPCAQVEKATHGFPVFTAMTNFMYEMAGNINQSNTLPVIIEPVCV